MNAALVMINYALTGIAYSGKKVTSQELALGVEGELRTRRSTKLRLYLRSHFSDGIKLGGVVH